jgi:hypothetical protein
MAPLPPRDPRSASGSVGTRLGGRPTRRRNEIVRACGPDNRSSSMKGQLTMRRLCLVLILLAACVLPANAQLACSNVDYGKDKPCSLTGVNGDCTLIVDRMRAATPPTIYVRRGSTVTLKVINPSPLEKLELDETLINTQIPIDSVQALAPLLTGLGQFVLGLPQPTGTIVTQNVDQTSTHPPNSKSFDAIVGRQKALAGAIDAHTKIGQATLDQVQDALVTLRVLLVPPLDACNKNSAWSAAYTKLPGVAPELTAVHDTIQNLVGDPKTAAGGAGGRLDADSRELASIQADIDMFASGMAAAQKEFDDQIAGLKTSIANLQKQIDDEQKKPHPDAKLIKNLNDQIASKQSDIAKNKEDANQAATAWQAQLEQLKAGQGVLTDKLTKAQTLVKTVLFPAETKLQTLSTAIQQAAVFAGPFTISDLLNKDKNDQQEVFTLNAVNDLTDPVKIFVASAAIDPYSQTLADSIVATPPTKTAVMQATVQYVTQPEMEVTAGVLVPFLPYKSYTAVPQSAGSATLVVQETHTFTIIPAVDLNFRLGNDKFAGNKRYGWFATIAVGYNPATTMVEFGVGPSVALKSMVFSFLADIGRDTALTSGFTNNQPLPGAATVPATKGVWSVKPSFGFSIRLPFNSGSGH